MDRSARAKLIKEIEAKRGTRVLAYVTGDRTPTMAQIGDDSLRPIYDQLRGFGKQEKVDVFIYSRGGAIDIPWRIATALRQTAKTWNILIPFRANSAATLLALGADQIVLGRNGELGPIDPNITIQKMTGAPGGPQNLVQEQFNVEDVMAFLKFVRDRVELKGEEAVSASLGRLADRIDPIALGNTYRTHSHIRDVARRMLQSQKVPREKEVIDTIVETLAEKVYAHGHAIGFKDATEVGLPVIEADPTLDDLMWALLQEYETDLKLRKPLDVHAAVSQTDNYREDAVIAMVESSDCVFELQGQVEVRARRQMPAQLVVTVNPRINMQQPVVQTQADGAQPAALDPQAMLQMLAQQLGPQIAKDAEQAVREALAKQAPLVGIDAGFRNGLWVRID
jgi:hypothetical protein